MAAPSQSDALIIGGGHNGLVAGAYLARAGKKVVVLERRHIAGGAAVTEDRRSSTPEGVTIRLRTLGLRRLHWVRCRRHELRTLLSGPDRE